MSEFLCKCRKKNLHKVGREKHLRDIRVGIHGAEAAGMGDRERGEEGALRVCDVKQGRF